MRGLNRVTCQTCHVFRQEALLMLRSQAFGSALPLPWARAATCYVTLSNCAQSGLLDKVLNRPGQRLCNVYLNNSMQHGKQVMASAGLCECCSPLMTSNHLCTVWIVGQVVNRSVQRVGNVKATLHGKQMMAGSCRDVECLPKQLSAHISLLEISMPCQ